MAGNRRPGTTVIERPAAPDEPGERTGRRRLLFSVWAVLVVAVAGGLVLLLVFPTRAWLAQRQTISETERRLELLDRENQRLEQEITRLQTPEEIERLARSQYNLVKPGEQPYAVLPPKAAPALPDQWPYGLVKEIVTARGGTPATTVPPEEG